MSSETFEIKGFIISSLNDFLKAIIKDKTILEFKNCHGMDVYLLASYCHHLDIMKYLENEHNWDVTVANNEGENAFILAAELKDIEVMKHLVEKHNINIHFRDNNGFDAFATAYHNESCESYEIMAYLNDLFQEEKNIKRKQVDENKRLLQKISELENEVKILKNQH